MNPDTFTADPDLLAATVDDLAAVGADLEELALALQARVERLHGSWLGQAATAHAEAHHRWDQSCGAMRDALTRMRAAAAVARDNYTSAADANARSWAELGS